MGGRYLVLGLVVPGLLAAGFVVADGIDRADGHKASACGPRADTYLVIFNLAPVNNNTHGRGFMLTYFDGVDEVFSADGNLNASKPERYDFSEALLRNVTAEQASCEMRAMTKAAGIFGDYRYNLTYAFKGAVLGTGHDGTIEHLKQIIDQRFFALEPELCAPSDGVTTTRVVVDGGPKERHSVWFGHPGSCSVPSIIFEIHDDYGALYGAAEDAASGRPPVTDPGGEEPPVAVPAVNFGASESDDRLIVHSASSAADWGRLALRTNDSLSVGGSDAPHQNQPATNATGVTPLDPSSMVMVSETSSLIRAGDYLAFCGTTGDVAEARIVIVDVPANMIMGEFVFINVAGCE